MIITLQEAKEFLKIDYNDEDVLIQELIQAAESYLFNATGKKFDGTNDLAKLYCFVLINEWHKDRCLTTSKNLSEKVRFTMQSIMAQLKYCEDSNGKV